MALIQKDLLPGRGDQLLTLDTATGLEWLNLTVTAHHSYLDVLSGFGGFVNVFGFRYATSIEVGRLYANAGIRKDAGPTPAIDEPTHYGIEVLQDLMNGKKLLPLANGTAIDTAGMVAFDGSGTPSSLSPITVRQTHLNHTAHVGSYTDVGGMTQKAGARSPEVGSYLVRANVGSRSNGLRKHRR